MAFFRNIRSAFALALETIAELTRAIRELTTWTRELTLVNHELLGFLRDQAVLAAPAPPIVAAQSLEAPPKDEPAQWTAEPEDVRADHILRHPIHRRK